MKKALLVIDVQNEYFTGKLPVKNSQTSFPNILRLIDKSNESGIPVILIQHSALAESSPTFRVNSLEWHLKDELLSKKFCAIVEKNFPSSFFNTKLGELLYGLNVDSVVICGYMTQMCCDTTARDAFHLAYGVEFISDATGTIDISNSEGTITAEELHKAILITQAMRFSKVLTTDNWIANN